MWGRLKASLLNDEYLTESKTLRRKCDGMGLFSSKGVGEIVMINGKMTKKNKKHGMEDLLKEDDEAVYQGWRTCGLKDA
ncbi:hypothetical protein AVEN_192040-1 [Araneus ventricosus]|uniref:Uncharacterized protein n=1 Tax=Araneus ventricosus TaxID=182803 RepID=A0A4Y2B9U9_ARAVE|nr:hypothetical protein AVEN_192040-1 [Araneus ventricosus]